MALRIPRLPRVRIGVGRMPRLMRVRPRPVFPLPDVEPRPGLPMRVLGVVGRAFDIAQILGKPRDIEQPLLQRIAQVPLNIPAALKYVATGKGPPHIAEEPTFAEAMGDFVKAIAETKFGISPGKAGALGRATRFYFDILANPLTYLGAAGVKKMAMVAPAVAGTVKQLPKPLLGRLLAAPFRAAGLALRPPFAGVRLAQRGMRAITLPAERILARISNGSTVLRAAAYPIRTAAVFRAVGYAVARAARMPSPALFPTEAFRQGSEALIKASPSLRRLTFGWPQDKIDDLFNVIREAVGDDLTRWADELRAVGIKKAAPFVARKFARGNILFPGVETAAGIITTTKPPPGAQEFVTAWLKDLAATAKQPGVIARAARRAISLRDWITSAVTFGSRGGFVQREALRESIANKIPSAVTFEAITRPSAKTIGRVVEAHKLADDVWRALPVNERSAVLSEVITLGKDKIDDMLFTMVETPGFTHAALSPSAGRFLRAWADSISNDLKALDMAAQMAHLNKYYLPAQVRDLVRDLMLRNRGPLNKRNVIYIRKFVKQMGISYPDARRILNTMPTAIDVAEVGMGYAPHLPNPSALAFMEANPAFVGRFEKGAISILLKKFPKATEQQLRDYLGRHIHIWKAGQLPRHPLQRYLTADEINKIAWDAGLPKEITYINKSIASAYQTYTRNAALHIGEANAYAAVRETARAIPELRLLQDRFGEAVAKDPKIFYVGSYRDSDIIYKGAGRLKNYFLMRYGREWRILDKDLADAVINTRELLGGKPAIEDWLQGTRDVLNKVAGKFKSLALNYSMSFHTTNWVGDLQRAFVMLGDDLAYGLKNAAELYGGGKVSLSFADGVQVFDEGRAFLYVAKARGLYGFFLSEAGTTPTMGDWYSRFGRVFRLPFRAIDAIGRLSMQFGTAGEDFRAEATFLAALKRYSALPFKQAVEKASEIVRQTMFVYPEITAWERRWPSTLIFFYRFARKNIPFWMRAALEHPVAAYAMYTFPERVLGLEPMERERFVPEWIRRRGGFITGREGHLTRYMVSNMSSLSDVIGKLTPGEFVREWVSMLTPAIRIPLEALFRYNIYLARDIDDINRIYSPEVARALSIFNPVAETLTKKKLVHKVTHRGKRYWLVRGHVLWALSQIRPLNDLIRFFDYMSPGSDRYAGMLKTGLWLTTGMRGVEVDTLLERRKIAMKQMEDLMEELKATPLVRELRIPVPIKGIQDMNAYERFKVMYLLNMSRGLRR